MNLGRVRARRILELHKAVRLVLNNDPEEVGSVMLQAGGDLKAVSDWVYSQKLAAAYQIGNKP